MASSEEALKAENARLVTEMASMKKKIMAALKKQQAELQGKIQAAEQRALTAEAAAAAASSTASQKAGGSYGENGSVSNATGSQTGTALPVNAPLVESDRYNSETCMEVESPHSSFTEVFVRKEAESIDDEAFVSKKRYWDDIETLKAELEMERQRIRKQEESASMEKQRLQEEIREMKLIVENQAKEAEQMKEKLELELNTMKMDTAKQVEQLKKVNEKLENQLLAAAEQVSDAFARMSLTHDDLERVSKEGYEARCAHADTLEEHERKCKELESVRASLLEAQKVTEDKTKELEEVAAVRKAAQESQEAAMAQLMQRLQEMDASIGQEKIEPVKEKVGELSLEKLLKEKAELTEELQEKNEALSELQRYASDLQNRLNITEASASKALDTCEGNLQVDDEEGRLLVTLNSELKTENKLLKAQLQESQFQSRETGFFLEKPEKGDEQQVLEETCLVQEVAGLRIQLQESTAAHLAAEKLVKQFQMACKEAEERAANISLELAEVNRKMEEEINARDEKYAELDAKFGKLQKRAKQHIQGLQKEKEDAETQLAAATEKATQALLQQTSLQIDLERMRVQAGEALRSLDGERQQLRNSNNRQKEIIDDLRLALEAKEHEFLETQRLASEKEQVVLELSSKLKDMEAKQEAVLADLVSKHNKAVLSLESQLADAVQERSKATDTISSLQLELGKKESQIAELEAASTGEAVRLGASLEAARGELSRIEHEQRKERETSEANYELLRRKIEESEKVRLQEELAAAKARSELESELEGHRQALVAGQAELVIAREQVAHLEKEFSAYKVRAYSLLQKKEAELLAAKDTGHLAAQEAALQEALKEAASAVAARDHALKLLQEVNAEHEGQLAARSVALLDAEQKIRDLATKLEATKSQMLSEQEAWQDRLDNLDASWRLKYEAHEVKLKEAVTGDMRNELVILHNDYDNLKKEYESFQEMANAMVEAKDQEIARLLGDMSELQKSIHAAPKASREAIEQPVVADDGQEDISLLNTAVAEQQILLLARQQAQREEELAQCHRHIQALQEEVAELEHENRLHTQQGSLLKEELRNLERSKKREGVDMTYLKNVILKLLETGEVEALLPVIAMLLQFSPEELKRCQEGYNGVPDVFK